MLAADLLRLGSLFTDRSHPVLGRTVADNLFPEKGAVGQIVRIKNVPFRVIGSAAYFQRAEVRDSGVSDLQIVIKRDATTVYTGNFGGLGVASTDVTGSDPLLAVDNPATTADNEKTTTFSFTVTLKATADPLSQGKTAGASYAFITSPLDGQGGLSGIWN